MSASPATAVEAPLPARSPFSPQADIEALGSAAKAPSGAQAVPLFSRGGSELPVVLAGGFLGSKGLLLGQQDLSRAVQLKVAPPLCPSDSPGLFSGGGVCDQ